MTRRFLALALVSPGLALADSIYPVTGVENFRLDIRTGEYWPEGGSRYGPGVAWDRSAPPSGFYGGDIDGGFREILDWGDVGTIEVPVRVNGFRFSYCTDGLDLVTLLIAFYANENGHPSEENQVIALFQFSSLPGRNPDSQTNCYNFDIDLPDPDLDQFLIAGNDLDQDGRIDFGYGMQIISCGDCGMAAGPMLAEGPIATSPGSTPQFDIYESPGRLGGGQYLRSETSPFGTLGQFALRLYTEEVQGCPQVGCDSEGVDVDFDGDCQITLADLTTLLAGFGTAQGADPDGGDSDGDGDVDLSDLTNLLARFGNVCN